MSRILIADERAEDIDEYARFLSQAGHNVQSADDAESAVHRLRAWKPHLILLDSGLDPALFGGSPIQGPNPTKAPLSGLGQVGSDLIAKMRLAAGDEYTSIVLLKDTFRLGDSERLQKLGVDDYLVKPVKPEELLFRVHVMLKFKEVQDSIRRANHRNDELSSNDELTGLMNMRAVFRRGEEEILRSRRFKRPLSALQINLDDFFSVNRNYGFEFGNHVLKEVGRRIKQSIRTIDLAARIGADDFFVLLIETDLAGAEFVAEKVRDAIQTGTYKDEKQSTQLTASVGIGCAIHDQTEKRMSDLLHVASEALRSAKENGANRVEIYTFG